MNAEEIACYLDTGEWREAAGGYRIQQRGAFFVESIEGSYSNIVGLPLSLFYGMLRGAGYVFT
jgi:septum formation protein